MELWNIFIYFAILMVTEGDEDKILIYENEQDARGYHFRFVTSSGQERSETGEYEKLGNDLILRVKGYFSYQGTDGKQYKVTYSADEGGYVPKQEENIAPSYGQGQVSNEVELRISSAAIASLAGGGLG